MQTDKIYPRNFYNFECEYKNALKYKDYIQRLPLKIPMYLEYLENLVPMWTENPTKRIIVTSWLYFGW